MKSRLTLLSALLLALILFLSGCGEEEKTVSPSVSTPVAAEPTQTPELTGFEGVWSAVELTNEAGRSQTMPNGIRVAMRLDAGGRGLYRIDRQGEFTQWEITWQAQNGKGEVWLVGGMKFPVELKDQRLLILDDGETLAFARDANVAFDAVRESADTPEGEWEWTREVRGQMASLQPRHDEKKTATIRLAAGGKGDFDYMDAFEGDEGTIYTPTHGEASWTWWQNQGTVSVWGEVFNAQINNGYLILWAKDNTLLVFSRK